MALMLRRPVRRWLQFRLTTFLMFVLVAALAFGWWSDRRRLANRIGERDLLVAMLRAARNEQPLVAPGVFSADLDIPISPLPTLPPARVEFTNVDDLVYWTCNSNLHPDPKRKRLCLSRRGQFPNYSRC